MPITIRRLISAEDWAAKQIRGVQAVGKVNYEQGVQNPRKSPIQASIDAQGRYEEQMRKPEVLARRVTNLRKSSDDEWLDGSIKLGANRLVEGVTAREAKIRTRIQSLQAKVAAHVQTIDRMPNATDADRQNRMVENLKGMRALKGNV